MDDDYAAELSETTAGEFPEHRTSFVLTKLEGETRERLESSMLERVCKMFTLNLKSTNSIPTYLFWKKKTVVNYLRSTHFWARQNIFRLPLWSLSVAVHFPPWWSWGWTGPTVTLPRLWWKNKWRRGEKLSENWGSNCGNFSEISIIFRIFKFFVWWWSTTEME